MLPTSTANHEVAQFISHHSAGNPLPAPPSQMSPAGTMPTAQSTVDSSQQALFWQLHHQMFPNGMYSVPAPAVMTMSNAPAALSNQAQHVVSAGSAPSMTPSNKTASNSGANPDGPKEQKLAKVPANQLSARTFISLGGIHYVANNNTTTTANGAQAITANTPAVTRNVSMKSDESSKINTSSTIAPNQLSSLHDKLRHEEVIHAMRLQQRQPILFNPPKSKSGQSTEETKTKEVEVVVVPPLQEMTNEKSSRMSPGPVCPSAGGANDSTDSTTSVAGKHALSDSAQSAEQRQRHKYRKVIGGKIPAPLKKLSTTGNISPQKFLDDLLRSRGYSTKQFCSLEGGYYCKPTPLQKASYGTKIVQAVRSSDDSLLRRFLQFGLSRNPCNAFGESLLHMVCRRGNYKLLKLLSDFGCYIQVSDDFGRTPLHDACWTTEPDFDCVDLILNVDVRLLHIVDCRGAAPLAYVKRDNWGKWIEYFNRTKDKYWPPRDIKKDGEEPPPELCQEAAHSKPVPDPTGAADLSIATLLASGQANVDEMPGLTSQLKANKGESEGNSVLSCEKRTDSTQEQKGLTYSKRSIIPNNTAITASQISSSA
uniref:Uncharacterized protein n=1 Tax=Ditylum brightwellii TaxID=49249 RepID=A0A7S2A163_9STRA|mmetsp:Transcript_644/g.1041  ORF Transcript_644/g.1041 Transcript_644/m.1041 type:complete len:595 (+) Transcript_644:220-2004(+)